jgi:hypothetical protein
MLIVYEKNKFRDKKNTGSSVVSGSAQDPMAMAVQLHGYCRGI